MNSNSKRIFASKLTDPLADIGSLAQSLSLTTNASITFDSPLEAKKSLRLKSYSSSYKKFENQLLQEVGKYSSHLEHLFEKMNAKLLQNLDNKLIISDTSGNYKPIINKFPELPMMHFSDFHSQDFRTYDSPFLVFQQYTSIQSNKSDSESSSDTQDPINILSNIECEASSTYCEHCKSYYQNADIHRLTDTHQIRVNLPKHWKNVDKIIQKTFESFYHNTRNINNNKHLNS